MRDPAPPSRPRALPCTTPKRSEEPLSSSLQAHAPPRAARFFPSARTSPTRAPAERSSPGVLPSRWAGSPKSSTGGARDGAETAGSLHSLRCSRIARTALGKKEPEPAGHHHH